MDRISIVAVASSTGDLEAVYEFLSALPAACAQAFVIVQHLEAGRRETLLAETLANRTSLKTVDTKDGVVPEQGHIYLTRANATLTIVDGRISLIPSASGLHRPGDTLFTSLAADRGESAIGIVLSGGGSDGALGVQAIKKAGGTTFAQYPGSARFPSMPINAIETGCVKFVMRPNEIARELTRLSHLDASAEYSAPRVPLIGLPVTA